MPCPLFAEAAAAAPTAHKAATSVMASLVRIGWNLQSSENRCLESPRGASGDGSARVKRSSLRRNVSVTRVHEAVDPVRDETGRGQPQQERPVARVRELLQRAVEADRLLRVVLDGRLDRESAHEPEDDEARAMADDTRTGAPRRVAAGPLVLELPRDPAVEVPQTDAGDDRTADRDEDGAARPRHDPPGGVVRLAVLRLRVAADEDVRGRVREPGIDQAAPRVADPLRRLVTAPRLHEAPDRIGREPGSEEDEEHRAERRAGELLQGALASRRLAAVAECQLQREHADDPERHALRNESRAREHRVPTRAAFRLRRRTAKRLDRLHGHLRLPPARAGYRRDNERTASAVT